MPSTTSRTDSVSGIAPCPVASPPPAATGIDRHSRLPCPSAGVSCVWGEDQDSNSRVRTDFTVYSKRGNSAFLEFPCREGHCWHDITATLPASVSLSVGVYVRLQASLSGSNAADSWSSAEDSTPDAACYVSPGSRSCTTRLVLPRSYTGDRIHKRLLFYASFFSSSQRTIAWMNCTRLGHSGCGANPTPFRVKVSYGIFGCSRAASQPTTVVKALDVFGPSPFFTGKSAWYLVDYKEFWMTRLTAANWTVRVQPPAKGVKPQGVVVLLSTREKFLTWTSKCPASRCDAATANVSLGSKAWCRGLECSGAVTKLDPKRTYVLSVMFPTVQFGASRYMSRAGPLVSRYPSERVQVSMTGRYYEWNGGKSSIASAASTSDVEQVEAAAVGQLAADSLDVRDVLERMQYVKSTDRDNGAMTTMGGLP